MVPLADRKAAPEVAGRTAGLAVMVAIIAFYVHLYRVEIVPFHGYMGLAYAFDWNLLTLTCYALAVVPIAWLPLRIQRPSQVVLWFLYLMVVMPACTTPLMADQFDDHTVLLTASLVAGAHALLSLLASLPTVALPRFRLTDRHYEWLLIGVFVLMFGVCLAIYGVRWSLPTLADIYGLREEFGQQHAEHGRLVGYIVYWFAKGMTVLMFVVGSTRRRGHLVLLAIIGQAYAFSLLAEKALFFSLFFVGGIMLLLRWSARGFGLTVGTLTLVVMGIGKLQSVLFGNGLILFMTARRVFTTPGLNTASYVEYFSYFGDKVLYAGNLFGRVLPIDSFYGFDLSPGRVVGLTYRTYAEGLVVNMNVNLWGEGFADWGVPGVLIATVVLAGVLWIYDCASRRLQLVTSGGILAGAVLGLVDGSLFTQLMTNGLLFLIVMVAVMPAAGGDGDHGES